VKVQWTPEARQDRADIWDYLFARDENAAARIDGLFSEAAAQLSEFPMLGHEGEVAGTRELTAQQLSVGV
jgi:plasmid stabilization system protein ParE